MFFGRDGMKIKRIGAIRATVWNGGTGFKHPLSISSQNFQRITYFKKANLMTLP
jgi:hypothetical protein